MLGHVLGRFSCDQAVSRMISDATISKKATCRHIRTKLYFALRLDGHERQ